VLSVVLSGSITVGTLKMKILQNQTLFMMLLFFFETRGCKRHFIFMKGVPASYNVGNIRLSEFLFENARIYISLLVLINSSTGFRGISRLGSAFIFLQWFKLAHICIQVTSLHKWKKQGINHKFLIGKRFHVTLRIVSPIICEQC